MLKNKKKIAILLAAYNGEKYLAEQIESLISQTNQEWSLYIRNDGSKDNTQAVIDHYCEKYDHIFEIDHGGKNLGCNGTFFYLLKAVESEYYMFCDADDVWFDDKIEKSFNKVKELESIGKYADKPVLVHTNSAIYDAELNLVEPSYWKSVNVNPERFLTFNQLCICCCIGGSTMLFNNKVKNVVLPENKTMMFDHWIAINTVKTGVIGTIHSPTKKYRQHANNVCGVTLGDSNSFLKKITEVGSLWKQYKKESAMLKEVGFGGLGKYLFYKALVVCKMRLLKY